MAKHVEERSLVLNPCPQSLTDFRRRWRCGRLDSRVGCKSALMIPDAFSFQNEYAQLKMPVSIIAGEDDRLIDIDRQSSRLHDDISQSTFHRVSNNGHMVHQTATNAIMSAIDEVVQAASSEPSNNTKTTTKPGPVLLR